MNTLSLYPIARFDAPEVLDASVTNIPASGSSPVQVVASLAKPCRGLWVMDGIGQFIDVFTGAPGSEVRVGTIGGGGSEFFECVIGRGVRVSLRNSENFTLTTGKLHVQFMGQT